MNNLAATSIERNRRISRVEEMKAGHNPLATLRNLGHYAEAGFSSITDADKSFFLKCFGILYTPLNPEKFMLRLRIPGGVMTTDQAYRVADVAEKIGNRHLDLTTRMQLELRGVSTESLKRALCELEEAGISTFQTGVDNFRNVVCDPLEGVAYDAILETRDILLSIERLYLGNPEWIGTLPRKLNTAIIGSLSNRCNAYGHDISFVLAEKNGTFGFNLYLGGKVGSAARYADRFLRDKKEVLLFFESLAKVYKQFGFRDNRKKNRLKDLIEAVGMEDLMEAVEEEAEYSFSSGGRTIMKLGGGERTGKVLLRDGTYAVHMVVPAGIFNSKALREVAAIARLYGSGEVRFTTGQNLYIPGIREESLHDMLSLPVFQEYNNSSSPYLSDLIACAGEEYCSFGVIPDKSCAVDMASYLTAAVPLEEGKVRMYWSGCSNGCGIHGTGDIGFAGTRFRRNGRVERGVNITIGGTISSKAAEGRVLLKAVPLGEAAGYAAEIASLYKNLRVGTETFEECYARRLADIPLEVLSFIVRFNYLIRRRIGLKDFNQSSIPGASAFKNEDAVVIFLGKELKSRIDGSVTNGCSERLYGLVMKMTDPLIGQGCPVFEEILADLEKICTEKETENERDLCDCEKG